MFTRPPFLFFQHNQQCDTLPPIVPCAPKLKAGIAYSTFKTSYEGSDKELFISRKTIKITCLYTLAYAYTLTCTCSYCSKLSGTLYSSCSVFFNLKLYTILGSQVYLSVMLLKIGDQIVILG